MALTYMEIPENARPASSAAGERRADSVAFQGEAVRPEDDTPHEGVLYSRRSIL